MAVVVMADDGIEFDGTTPEHAPLGGAEAAFVALAEGFAARGHRVLVRNRCGTALCHHGVEWAPLGDGLPARADLFIANRGHRLIGAMPASRGIFWLHNPGRYLRKPRYLWALARHRPVIVTTGAYHAATVPWWMPSGGRAVIPYGMAAPFQASRAAARAPAAAGDLHLEPVARIRTGCSISGRGGFTPSCPRRSSIFIAAPRSMAVRARRSPRRWRKCWRAPMRSGTRACAATRRCRVRN